MHQVSCSTCSSRVVNGGKARFITGNYVSTPDVTQWWSLASSDGWSDSVFVNSSVTIVKPVVTACSTLVWIRRVVVVHNVSSLKSSNPLETSVVLLFLYPPSLHHPITLFSIFFISILILLLRLVHYYR